MFWNKIVCHDWGGPIYWVFCHPHLGSVAVYWCSWMLSYDWLIPELCLTNAELCLVNRGCCLVNAYGESCVCWMLNAKCGVMFGGCCFQECWLMMFNVDRDWWVMFELWWLFVSYVCGIVIECWIIVMVIS